jgi:hypothetical protein
LFLSDKQSLSPEPQISAASETHGVDIRAGKQQLEILFLHPSGNRVREKWRLHRVVTQESLPWRVDNSPMWAVVQAN